MSSHREAPEISKDPVADNTDVYAFVTPNAPNFVTLIANFIPLQSPGGGPNFYEFGDDVAYRIHISNSGDAQADVTYEFRFHTKIRNDKTFLYNVGPISKISDPNWNRPQRYSVSKQIRNGTPRVIASNLGVPPNNVGPRSTPNYDETFTKAAVHRLGGGRRVFAGQRSEAFFVDLGSIFDLGALRPFQHLHLIPSADAMGVNGLQGFNVHTIALQVPITDLTRGGVKPTRVNDKHATIGVWSSTHRQASRVFDSRQSRYVGHGPFRQVSRLGNPLFNEVIVPMAEKDAWNATAPRHDSTFAKYVLHPELGGLLPVLYPGVFPHLAKYKKPRADLAAILLTGIPAGIIPGFQNFTGPVQSDMQRLNVAIPPTPRGKSSPYGILGGDLAGFPNGRRPWDDIVAIELRAIAGATIPLVDPSYKPDDAASALKDGTTNTNLRKHPGVFPFLGSPAGGYQTKPAVPGT